MHVSQKRIEANRRNAARSTGPRTVEGKEQSRANALKHGLAGEGIALPNEDAAEVSRRFAALDEEMRPRGELARVLVRRVALLTVRMERCARHEAAALAEKIRHAEAEFDDRRAREVEVLADQLAREPETAARRLRMTVEGVDWMLRRWDDLRYDLEDPDRDRWGRDHGLLAENLMGRRYGYVKASRVLVLSDAIQGHLGGLSEQDGAGLENEARIAWARSAMAAEIEAQMEGLREARAAIDVETVARDRAGAADRALFDDSPKATLARRYEAAAERGMYRALRALKDHAPPDAEDAIDDDDTAPAEPVGSSRPASSPAPGGREDRRPVPVVAAPMPRPLGSIGARVGSRRGREVVPPTAAFDVVVGLRAPLSVPAIRPRG